MDRHIPHIRFLFVRLKICRRLPSDSTLRRTHLPLANDSHYQGSFWVPTHSLYTCQTHEKFRPNSEFWKEKNACVGSVAIFISAGIDYC